ncbi:helix-turn-helix domain-containing protein [Streptomyces yangpuensis]|uniref:helix-turn-helix domain-containing protein n=1 Tax=Streptomyces yangpuensis TaxID=1648182 RepID=UPI0036440A33
MPRRLPLAARIRTGRRSKRAVIRPAGASRAAWRRGVRGRVGGRPPKLNNHQIKDLIQQHADGARVPVLAKRFKVSQATVYRLLNLSHLERAPSQSSGSR